MFGYLLNAALLAQFTHGAGQLLHLLQERRILFFQTSTLGHDVLDVLGRTDRAGRLDPGPFERRGRGGKPSLHGLVFIGERADFVHLLAHHLGQLRLAHLRALLFHLRLDAPNALGAVGDAVAEQRRVPARVLPPHRLKRLQGLAVERQGLRHVPALLGATAFLKFNIAGHPVLARLGFLILPPQGRKKKHPAAQHQAPAEP